MSGGRPTTYNEEIAAEICARIAEGQSLRTICQDEDMPDASTVFRWLPRQPEFRDQYTHAREAAADAMSEDIMDIADDGTNDWMERKRPDGSTEEVLNSEHIQRSKLRVDTRKWLMSKLAPKKYGEKVTHAHGGDPDGEPIQVETSDRDRAKAMASLMLKANDSTS